MFSQTAEYALRAAISLTVHHPAPQTAQQISTECQIPIDYLFKVLQSLSRAGLVNAQRGKHGGFTLAKDPESLSILDVIQAVDPIKRIRECPLNLKQHGVRLCPLHRRLDDAVRLIEESFASTKLTDLLSESAELNPLCAKPAFQTVRSLDAKPY